MKIRCVRFNLPSIDIVSDELFYRDLLGFISSSGNKGNQKCRTLSQQNVILNFTAVTKDYFDSLGKQHITFEIESIDDFYARCTELPRIEITAMNVDPPGIKSFDLRDPSVRIVSIVETSSTLCKMHDDLFSPKSTNDNGKYR